MTPQEQEAAFLKSIEDGLDPNDAPTGFMAVAWATCNECHSSRHALNLCSTESKHRDRCISGARSDGKSAMFIKKRDEPSSSSWGMW